MQVGPHERVERPQRLVEQQHVGVNHQRPNEGHALPLSAAHLGRVTVQNAGGEAGETTQVGQPFGSGGGVQPEVFGLDGRVAAARQVGEQPAVLDHVPEPPSQGGKGRGVNRPAVKR